MGSSNLLCWKGGEHMTKYVAVTSNLVNAMATQVITLNDEVVTDLTNEWIEVKTSSELDITRLCLSAGQSVFEQALQANLLKSILDLKWIHFN